MVFLFLSPDEMLELHEHFVHLTQRLLDLSGFGTGLYLIKLAAGTSTTCAIVPWWRP